MSDIYQDQQDLQFLMKLRKQEKNLPKFMTTYFRGIESVTAPRTRLAYSYDLGIFFNYLCNYESDFEALQPVTFTISDLQRVNIDHLEAFLEYSRYYSHMDNEGNVIERTNKERGISRKTSALRAMFKYFFKRRDLDSNPAELLSTPKIHERPIIALEPDEVAKLLDNIESGDKLTTTQKQFHSKTKERDLAIVTLLLGTGMRISECVGIDLDDLDFNTNAVRVRRKGGDIAILYFNEEVCDSLLTYLVKRNNIVTQEGHDNALFLSLQNRRITSRTIQKLVKKYTLTTTPLKKITPHKLRSTYGTTLYRESSDIYLVASALGHKDVNTTRKFYAKMSLDQLKSASRYIKLREDD